MTCAVAIHICKPQPTLVAHSICRGGAPGVGYSGSDRPYCNPMPMSSAGVHVGRMLG